MKASVVNNMLRLLTGGALVWLELCICYSYKKSRRATLASYLFFFQQVAQRLIAVEARYYEPSHICVVKELQYQTGLFLYLYFHDGSEIIFFDTA